MSHGPVKALKNDDNNRQNSEQIITRKKQSHPTKVMTRQSLASIGKQERHQKIPQHQHWMRLMIMIALLLPKIVWVWYKIMSYIQMIVLQPITQPTSPL